MMVARNHWNGGTKKPCAKPGSVWGPVLLWPMNKQCMIMIQVALQVRSQIGNYLRLDISKENLVKNESTTNKMTCDVCHGMCGLKDSQAEAPIATIYSK